MFDEGQKLPSPYHRTKFESERIVREQPYVPWRVYRPGIVVGDSQTGEMDKIDGPYYFFKAIQRMRQLLPEWVPLVGLDLGNTNIVPVDWVAGALDHIAHEPDLDGRAFHLTDPRPPARGRADQRVRRRRARAALRGEHRQTPDRRAAEVAADAGAARCRRCARRASLALRELGIPERCSRTWSSCPLRHARGRAGAGGLGARAAAGAARLRARGCGTTGSARWTRPGARALAEGGARAASTC